MIPIPAEIFKAYDIRGIVGKTLNDQWVELIGQAIGSEAINQGNSSVVVGRDGRLSGPAMRDALVRGIVSTGANVIDIGMVPTPVVYFATHHLDSGASVSITGSHNPPDYNGFKVMIGGSTLSGDAIQDLYKRITDRNFLKGSGNCENQDVNELYLDRIISDVHLNKKFKIVIDCGNGVAGALAPELYNRLGCETIELFTTVDGTFPNHHPDPIDEKNLVDLKQAVRDNDADIGLAFDGDGDRLGVVTSTGEVIWPDRQMILFSEDILNRQPCAEIIFDVKCTAALRSAIEDMGGVATMYKTGHSLIKSKLRESGAALAGEMSGHIFFQERWYGFDDGLYTGARLLELLSNKDESPDTVFSKLPNPINTPELRLELQEGQQHELIKELVANANFTNATTHTKDGLRVEFSNGFGLVRASNTTPTAILRFEATSVEGISEIQDKFRALFTLVRPDLALPF